MLRASLLYFLGRRRWKLVFVEQPFSGWTPGQIGEKPTITVRSQLVVTNPSDDEGVIVVRAQIGRAGFLHRRALQDCHSCYIGDEPVFAFSPGVLIKTRTTATMQITHPFEVEKLPTERSKTVSFRVVATDQLNRKHVKRIKLRKFGA